MVVVGGRRAGRARPSGSRTGPADRVHHQGLPDPARHSRRAGRHLRRARNMGGTTGASTSTHIKGSDWLGDQAALSTCPRGDPGDHRARAQACRFAHDEDGRSTTSVRRMTTHYGKGIAQRTSRAADRTGHAILHTLYQQRSSTTRRSSSNTSRLISSWTPTALVAACWRSTWPKARCTCSAPTAPFSPPALRPRVFQRDLGPYLHRDGAVWRCAPGSAAGHGFRCSPSHRHSAPAA